MEKQIFKVGDQVFDIRFGWGKVLRDERGESYPIEVKFENLRETIIYTSEGKSAHHQKSPFLSFTEYTLQGFSQERPPINYNDYIGEWGVFWDRRCNGYYISKLKEIDVNNGFTEFVDSDSGKWDKFRPLTEEQIKVLKSCD